MPVRRSFVIVLMRLHQGKGKRGFSCCQIVLVLDLNDVSQSFAHSETSCERNLKHCQSDHVDTRGASGPPVTRSKMEDRWGQVMTSKLASQIQ
jgi:hypothetical protein